MLYCRAANLQFMTRVYVDGGNGRTTISWRPGSSRFVDFGAIKYEEDLFPLCCFNKQAYSLYLSIAGLNTDGSVVTAGSEKPRGVMARPD